MPTAWEHQVFVIGAAAVAPGVVAALDAAFPRDDKAPRNPADVEKVACPMSASGADPATHYGAAFSIKETIRAQLEGMGLAATPGVIYWRCSNPEGILTATNHPASQAGIGQPWTWAQCKAAAGLQQIFRAPQ